MSTLTLTDLSRPICSAQAAANYFIAKAKEENRRLTPMQLIKLVYIAHGWVLALLRRPLIDEAVEAWDHGPVIPSLYHEFKHFGARPITEQSKNIDWDNQFEVPTISSAENNALAVLEKVWSIYKDLSGGQLRSLTHRTNTPWSKNYQEGKRHVPIPDTDVYSHYVELIKGYLESPSETCKKTTTP